jgi:hypothetical protein
MTPKFRQAECDASESMPRAGRSGGPSELEAESIGLEGDLFGLKRVRMG